MKQTTTTTPPGLPEVGDARLDPRERRRRTKGAAITMALLALSVCFAVSLTSGRPGSPNQPRPSGPVVMAATTQRVSPGQSIQAAIDSAGPGGTVVIGAGIHSGQSVIPLDDMTLTGEAGAILDGSGAPLPYAIYGSASGVTVSHLEIRNYTKPIWGANNYRHQGAIHGAMMNGGGGFVAIARNWRIESNVIHDNAGWGVSPGDNFTVVQNALHHNGMAGIGGGDFNGGLFEKNDIYANNDPSNSYGDFNYETGRKWDWAWNAAGIKVANVNCRTLASTGSCSGGTPLVIRSNNVHDNVGVGIWCDINCNDVIIEKNLVERNIGVDSVGIFYEISQNGVIRDNVVRDQGASGDYLNPSGILVWSSDGVRVERNQVEGTANAIVGNARPREFGRTLRNLTVVDNVIITRGRSTRVGIASDTATDFKIAGNSFGNNYYDNTAKMAFWWTDISRGESSLTIDQWRALGFTPAAAPPASPQTPAVIAPAAPAQPAAPVQPVAPSQPAAATSTSTSTTTTNTTTTNGAKSSATTTPRSPATSSNAAGAQNPATSTNQPASTDRPSTASSTPADATAPEATTAPLMPAATDLAPIIPAQPPGASPQDPAATEQPAAAPLPVDTAPQALAFAPDDDPAAAPTTSTTTVPEPDVRDAETQDEDQATTDGPELGIGVEIGDGPPSESSAMFGIIQLLGLTVAGVAIWLTGRSLLDVVRRRATSIG